MMKSPREIQAIAKILGGVPVFGVLPGTPAHDAGMRYGDIIVRVNGLESTTFERFLRAHEENDGLIALEIFRNGTTLNLHVDVGPRREANRSTANAALA